MAKGENFKSTIHAKDVEISGDVIGVINVKPPYA